MNKFTYRVYYELKRTKAYPNASPKSTDEIEHALLLFPSRLRHFLNDPDAQVNPGIISRTSNSVRVAILTRNSAQQFSDAIVYCLNELGLFGEDLTHLNT